MQRIGKMGGTIVNIEPLEALKQQEQNDNTEAPEETKATRHKNKRAAKDNQN
jgi:phycocyanin-associated, rod